jgi:photosystem II stability/assembly factor-like uncharacterized protein
MELLGQDRRLLVEGKKNSMRIRQIGLIAVVNRSWYFLLALCVLHFSSCKKDQLHPRNITQLETHTSNRLNNILFVNDSLGVAVGGSRFDEADILVTRDGGHTWALTIPEDVGKELFGIAVSPVGDIYLIGFEGHLLRSSDGALTWKHVPTRYEAYKALAFSDVDRALCIGGVSFDRGDAMWINQNGEVLAHDTTEFELNDIVLLADGHGYRSGYGVMQYSTDAGKTWNWTSLRNDNYKALDARSSLLAYTCGGEGSICVTRNGGKDWDVLRNGNDLTLPKYRLSDLLFTDEQHGYAVGENGVVIASDDGGKHWSEIESFTKEHLYSVSRCPDGALIVCGEDGGLWRIQL